MAITHDQTLSGRVQLDGNLFVNVDFNDAQLIYDGGVAPQFDNCRFSNSQFTFQGPAAHTLGFIRAMAPEATNMREVVLGLIPELVG